MIHTAQWLDTPLPDSPKSAYGNDKISIDWLNDFISERMECQCVTFFHPRRSTHTLYSIGPLGKKGCHSNETNHHKTSSPIPLPNPAPKCAVRPFLKPVSLQRERGWTDDPLARDWSTEVARYWKNVVIDEGNVVIFSMSMSILSVDCSMVPRTSKWSFWSCGISVTGRLG